MGKGKNKKNKKSSSYRPIKVETGEIEFLATVYVKGSFTTSDIALDKYEGDDVKKKIDQATRNYLDTKLSGLLSAVSNIRFKPKASKDDHFLAEYSIKLAKKIEKEEEDTHTYIGEIVCNDKKKVAIFTYPEIKESWRQQKEIWGTWKEFIKVFLDDLDSETVDLEEGDISGSYVIPEEKDLKKKLLRDFIEDSEKLGFKKLEKEKEPQT